jgi:hypothetical protein
MSVSVELLGVAPLGVARHDLLLVPVQAQGQAEPALCLSGKVETTLAV